MSRKSSFTLPDLKYEAGQVKRHLLNEARTGRVKKLIKKDVFVLVAKRPKVNLNSDRVLWNGEARVYLDSWYEQLTSEFTEITNNKSLANNNHELDLNSKVKEEKLKLIVREYKKALDILRYENEQLRILLIEKHGKIDI